METKLLSTIFLETLEKDNNGDFKNSATYRVFFCLFTILPYEDLESVLEYSFKQRKKDYWFAEFHKTMRQTDFYTNCFSHDSSPTIDKKEERELNRLNKELERVHKLMHKFERTLIIPNENDPTYVQKQAEYNVAYKLKKKKLFPEAKRLRRFELIRKLRNEEHRSINGFMDSILYNMIHVDKENVLYEVLRRTFNEFEFLNKKKKKRKAIMS